MARWSVVIRTPPLDVEAVKAVILADDRIGGGSCSTDSIALLLEADSVEDARAFGVTIVRDALPGVDAIEVSLVYDEQLHAVYESSAEQRRDPRLEVDDLIAVLAEPLTREDRVGGWNDDARKRWLEHYRELREGLDSGGPLRGAPSNVARWLDHDGIEEGPLTERIYDFQELLRRRLAGRGD